MKRLGVLLWFMGIPVLLLWPIWRNPTLYYMGGIGDPNEFQFYLGLPRLFFTHLMNYPAGFNLMRQTSIPAVHLLFGTLLVNGLPLLLVFNLVYYVNFILSMVFFYLLLRQFLEHKSLTFVGALLGVLAPYIAAQASQHLNFALVFPMYGIFYLLARWVKTGEASRWRIGGLIALLVFEFYTNLEMVATGSLFLGLGFLLSLRWFRSEWKTWAQRNRRNILIVSLFTLLFVSPGTLYFLVGPLHTMGLPHGLDAWHTFVTDLTNFVIPTRFEWFHNGWTNAMVSKWTGNLSEDDGYLGVPILLMILIGVVMGWKRPLVRILSLLFFIFAALSLGNPVNVMGHTTGFPGLFAPLEFIPVLNSALPCRLAFYVDVTAILLLLLFLDDLEGSVPVSTWVLLGVVIFFWLPNYAITKMPPSQFALRNQKVNQIIHGQPVVMVTPNFPEAMFALANDHYAFPVANFYSYGTPYTPTDANNLNTYLTYIAPKREEGLLRKAQIMRLKEDLPNLESSGIRDLVYFPTNGRKIEPEVQNVISRLLGSSVWHQKGIWIWRIHGEGAQK